MTTLLKTIHRPLPISWPIRAALSFAAFSICVYLAWRGYDYAAHKTTKIESSDQKAVALRALESTKDFGRIILDSEGKVVSWNAGMTQLTGWTYNEMVGQTLERLMPEDPEPILAAVFGEQVFDWQGHSNDVVLKRKDGTPVNAFLQVHDVVGNAERFRFIFMHRNIGEASEPK